MRHYPPEAWMRSDYADIVVSWWTALEVNPIDVAAETSTDQPRAARLAGPGEVDTEDAGQTVEGPSLSNGNKSHEMRPGGDPPDPPGRIPALDEPSAHRD